MKIKNLARTVISAAALAVFMHGCGSSHTLTNSEALDYLHERYDGYFHCTEEIEYTKTAPPPHVAENGTTYTYVPDESDFHYSFVDDEGITFELHSDMQIYGCGGKEFCVTDDYCWKWLLAHEDIYKPLMESDFDCAVIKEDSLNNVYGNNCIKMYIQSFNDLDKVAELVSSVVNSDGALLPDKGYTGEGRRYQNVACRIKIVTPQESELETVSFRSQDMTEPCDTELLRYCLKNSYVKYAKSDSSTADIPNDWKEGRPVNMLMLYKGNEKLSGQLTMNSEYYYQLREYNDTNNNKLWFTNLADLCENAGYKVKNKGHKQIKLTKGKDTVIIGCNKKGFGIFATYGDPVVTKNGKKYKLHGYCKKYKNSYELCLTCGDLYELFGISFDYDFVQQRATLSVK